MGRESLSLEFWEGFEKQAGILGQVGAKLTGRGAAFNRLQQIRKTAPGAFKPEGFMSQFQKSPSNAMANAAAKYTGKYNSPKERMLRTVGKGIIGGGALAYGVSKINADPDVQMQKRMQGA